MAIYDVHGNVLSESDIVVDNTLKKSGQAADAKVTGDRLDSLSEDKVDKNGWSADKYLGTDSDGNIVEKDNPSGGVITAVDTKTELNNPVSDIIATSIANAYTRKWTHKVIDDTSVVYNGGMLCNDPPSDGVMTGETKFSSSSDGRTEDSGTVNVRWVNIANTFGKNDFTFTSGDGVEIFSPGGEITRVDGSVVNATTGGFGDQILHDTTNNKYIVIAETFVGSENVVFARVTTAESATVAPTMDFTEPKELTLAVDGVLYNIQNGLLAINSDYDSVSQYNGDIAYIGGLFYWVLTNNYKGWIVLTSADGQKWEFNRYIVPENGAENLFIEAAIGYNTNTDTMLIAGRTKIETGYMVLTSYHVSSGEQCTKLIPDCRIGSKPSIAQYGYGYYVGHNIGNRADYELLFVNTYYSAISTTKFQTMDIWRVNAWHGISTQYATIRIGNLNSHYGYVDFQGKTTYASLLHCYGIDGNQFLKNGASFTYDAFDIAALSLNNGNQASLENAYYQKGLLENGIDVDDAMSEESTNPVQNAVVTKALSKKVGTSGWTADKYLGTDSDGNVVEKDAPSSSSGTSDTWDMIETYTVVEGDNYHKTELSKAYKKLYIFMYNVSASANANFDVIADTESTTYNSRKMARVSLTTASYRFTNIEIEKISSSRVLCKQSDQSGSMSKSTAYYWNTLQDKMPSEYLYFKVITDDVTLSGGTIEIYGIPE